MKKVIKLDQISGGARYRGWDWFQIVMR